VRLQVSHRGAEWRAPQKDGDVLTERDLMPTGQAHDTGRHRK
jgi:hypothetical protein